MRQKFILAILRSFRKFKGRQRSFTWHAGRVGVLVDKLHVLHEHLAAHAQLVADRAAAGVRAPDHVLVLQR